MFIEDELNTNPPSHKGRIHLLLQKVFLDTLYPRQYEVIKPYPCPPWTRRAEEIHNLELKHDEEIEKIKGQTEEEKLKGSMILCTDGSVIPQVGCGAAVVSDTTASNSFITNSLTSPGVVVFCNNQSAMQLVNDPPSYRFGQYLAIAIREIIDDLPPDFQIKFFCTPGHEWIELDEQADKAAREAAEEQEDPIILNTSLEKDNAVVIFQLRSNHNALVANLHRFNLSDPELCPTCKVPETTTHFLSH
ncbi:hypothetical protein CROQUDRAFT_109430 [Cronartium quercuum f. sp. fusiforme G11]|uniref:RNase H type-1 domain-containing protein n=1 Tax=Cronartium quercuum f. sp. fusiforme G11 TaxID=708437 RepID=A0A9P6T9Y2_9BASI|nr:hypothetical protein CROQUDRAFT_109430 [Cronartium quercuum f. sp. fusiforme G11]